MDEEQYCIDILTQVSAATKALEGVALLLLDQHLERCLTQAADAKETQQKLSEASAAIRRLSSLSAVANANRLKTFHPTPSLKPVPLAGEPVVEVGRTEKDTTTTRQGGSPCPLQLSSTPSAE